MLIVNSHIRKVKDFQFKAILNCHFDSLKQPARLFYPLINSTLQNVYRGFRKSKMMIENELKTPIVRA